MSESKIVDVNSLYNTLLREVENDSVQEVSPELYTIISKFVGNLKSEEYDGIEAKIKEALVKMMSDMTSILLKTRLEKATKTDIVDFTNLLDEEKYIIDAEDEMRERRDMILSSVLSGKSKLLESISTNHKTKSIVVRFLKKMDQIVGADLEKYGPFKEEDVATIPYENAQALIAKKIATKISWKD